MERAVRLELTIPDLQSDALATWRRAQIGTEGEIRTLESSLEDSHVSNYITSAGGDASQGDSRLGCGVRTVKKFRPSDRETDVTPHHEKHI